ncbi:hypothetical protein VNI00_011378 [Paramarasmius palmivorus]|uniref:DRBM domain-containing protein n=1 Tax=Paramarasmius palmivorus TaxID=297713 RepID=A0AAW0CG30_9AGAR
MSSSSQNVFELVSLNFRKIGAIPVDEYLDPTNDDQNDISYAFEDLNLDVKECRRAVERLQNISQEDTEEQLQSAGAGVEPTQGQSGEDPVTRLTQQCQRYLPQCQVEQVLKWDSQSTKDPQTNQVTKTCTFTISKPDGTSMSVQSTKKRGVRADTARIAIEKGALDFIAAGVSPDSLKNPSDSGPAQENPVAQIEEAMAKLASTHARICWYRHAEKLQKGGKCGYALLIRLSKGNLRAYSTPAAWDDEMQARIECANVALREGVVDYIQSTPGGEPEDFPPPSWDNLQHFFESLPRPFPGNVANATAEQMQAVKRLDDAVKQVDDMKHAFYIIHNKKDQLFGFVLRLEHADQVKTYLVEPRFRKEKEARAAVCLQAMSEDVESYLRSLSPSVDHRVTKEMRTLVRQRVLPALEQLRNAQPFSTEVKFKNDKNGFGASLKVKSDSQKKKFTVPKEYRSKPDAEDALFCIATRDGLFDFLSARSPEYASLAMEASAILTKTIEAQEHGEVTEGSKGRKKAKIPEFSPPFSLSSYNPNWSLPMPVPSYPNPYAAVIGKRSADGIDDERKRKRLKTAKDAG